MILFFTPSLFSDRMAEIIKEELDLEEFQIKEEIVFIREDILPSSTVEDTCKLEKFSYK